MNHGRNIAQFEKAKTAKKSKYINESRSGSSRRWWSDSYRIRRAKKRVQRWKKLCKKLENSTVITGWLTETLLMSPIPTRPTQIFTVALPCSLFLRFNLFSRVCVIFRLVYFTRPASLKKFRATEKSSLRLERIAKHKRSFSKRSRVKIICLRVVNFPCTDWLS